MLSRNKGGIDANVVKQFDVLKHRRRTLRNYFIVGASSILLTFSSILFLNDVLARGHTPKNDGSYSNAQAVHIMENEKLQRWIYLSSFVISAPGLLYSLRRKGKLEQEEESYRRLKARNNY